jgi:hypothetical protein
MMDKSPSQLKALISRARQNARIASSESRRRNVQASAYTREAEQLELQLAAMHLPVEPQNGLLQFTITFHPGGRKYDYVAIKAGGRWYKSGTKERRDFGWEELVEWIMSKPYWHLAVLSWNGIYDSNSAPGKIAFTTEPSVTPTDFEWALPEEDEWPQEYGDPGIQSV